MKVPDRQYFVLVYDELFEGQEVEQLSGVFTSFEEAKEERRKMFALHPRVTSCTIYSMKKVEEEDEAT